MRSLRSLFITFGVITLVLVTLSIKGMADEANRPAREAAKAASVERVCRGENLPSYGAPEPDGYRECIAASKAIAGLK